MRIKVFRKSIFWSHLIRNTKTIHIYFFISELLPSLFKDSVLPQNTGWIATKHQTFYRKNYK